jgi:hypothetical protein
MTEQLASAAVGAAGASLYAAIVPWIGGIGGFLTASNTGSNALFAQLQTASAQKLGLPLDWVAAAHNRGRRQRHDGLAGPRVLAAAVTGLTGRESLLNAPGADRDSVRARRDVGPALAESQALAPKARRRSAGPARRRAVGRRDRGHDAALLVAHRLLAAQDRQAHPAAALTRQLERVDTAQTVAWSRLPSNWLNTCARSTCCLMVEPVSRSLIARNSPCAIRLRRWAMNSAGDWLVVSLRRISMICACGQNRPRSMSQLGWPPSRKVSAA